MAFESFSLELKVGSNLTFKLISLNARGIRSFEKRKAVFRWLLKQKVDLCFLQETYSTKYLEKAVKGQDVFLAWFGT